MRGSKVSSSVLKRYGGSLVSHFRYLTPVYSGLPCDASGHYLPKGSPPKPIATGPPTDWSPFESGPAFRLAEGLYADMQASGARIDELLSNLKAHIGMRGGGLPFESSKELFDTIDRIEVGDIPWMEFTYKYSGETTIDSPTWQTNEYKVYFRDPCALVKEILSNTDFDGELDYAPYIHTGENGKRLWHDFMSANWAFNRAVSVDFTLTIAYVVSRLYRAGLLKIHKRTEQCWFQLYLVATRLLSPLQRVRTIFIHCTSLWGT